MSYNNGRITAPVGIYDVQRALGNNDGDLGTLIGSGGINKWARFKPIIVPKIEPLTYQENKNNGFGLDILYYYGKKEAFANIISNYATFEFGSSVNGTYKGWSQGVHYNYPNDNQNPYYRITDFVCYENESVLGYDLNAQLMWQFPGGSHAISSAVGDGNTIDLARVEDLEVLPDDTAAQGEVNMDVDIASQTSSVWNSLSPIEILRAHGMGTGMKRGVVFTDGNGGVTYIAIEKIPWGEWKASWQEAPLNGEWKYLEFYTNLDYNSGNNSGQFYLIPGLMGTCYFETGEGSITFVLGSAAGIVTYDSTLMKYVTYIEFARIAGDEVSDWDLTVHVYKVYDDGTKSTDKLNANINSLPSYESGYTWYNTYIGIDMEEGGDDSYGDIYEVQITGKRNNISEAIRTVFTGKFVLTQ